MTKRVWELVSGDHNLDIKNHTIVMEDTNDQGLRMQIPVCEIVALDILEEKYKDKKKAMNRFIQNSRVISSSLEMLSILKRVQKIISGENVFKEDFECVREDIASIIQKTGSTRKLGDFPGERLTDRKAGNYGRI